MFTRKTLWLSIIVSMIVGGIAGVLIERYWTQRADSHFGKTRFVSYMTKELDLTQQQQQQLDSIINFVHPRFHAIRTKFNADIKIQTDSTRKMISSILTHEQQEKLERVYSQMKSNSDNH